MRVLRFALVSLLLQQHPPYGDTVGTGTCLPEVIRDILGYPRPNRAPDTLFPGDTGCDIGAYQYVGPPPTITISISVGQ